MSLLIQIEQIKSQLYESLFELSKNRVQAPKLRDSSVFEIPNRFVPLLPPIQTSLSRFVEEITNIFQSNFKNLEIPNKSLIPLLPLFQEDPNLLGFTVDLLHEMDQIQLNTNHAKSTLGQNFHLGTQSLDLVKNLFHYQKDQHAFLGNQNVSKQGLFQIMARVLSFLKSAPTPEFSKQNSPGEILSFINFSLKEFPQSFERELFALPIVLKADFSLQEYQVLSTEIEPLELSLILLEVQKKTKKISDHPLIAQIKTLLEDPNELKSVLNQLKSLFKPKLPYDSHEDQNIKAYFPRNSVLTLAEGENRAVVLQAVSSKTGLLPNSSLQILPDAFQSSLQGSLLMTQSFHAGLHKLKLKFSESDNETLMGLLLYIVKGLDAQEEKENNEEGTKHKGKELVFSLEEDEINLKSPLAGNLGIALDAPFILMQPYKKAACIPAPLNVQFQFLFDCVDPKFKYSRTQFLSFALSNESQALRLAVKKMSQAGLKAFDQYQESLEAFFKSLEGMIPQHKKTFDRAKEFLEKEVFLFLMGKKKGRQGKLVLDLSHSNDLMASIFLSSAEALSQLEQRKSDALIFFTDACHRSDHKPYFQSKLNEFLLHLRRKASKAQSWHEEELHNDFILHSSSTI